MKREDKLSSLTETFRQVASTMLLSEAVFEILVEKGILSGEEVLERVKKLRSQTLSLAHKLEESIRLRCQNGTGIRACPFLAQGTVSIAY